MTFTTWTIFALVVAIAAVVHAGQLFSYIMSKDEGTDRMKEIARAIQAGGKAFLNAEYKWLAVFVAVVFVAMLFSDSMGFGMAMPFLLGALASGAAGYFGMHTATRAAVRTTQAARTSLSQALDISFKSGTVMGMTVVGLGLIGITLLLLVYYGGDDSATALNKVMGFSFGASSIALFARVGGGIYTKAADVGADLVGKVEAGIPEDDPRNPATIADNVGDNVGDVAGMGADLFESSSARSSRPSCSARARDRPQHGRGRPELPPRPDGLPAGDRRRRHRRVVHRHPLRAHRGRVEARRRAAPRPADPRRSSWPPS